MRHKEIKKRDEITFTPQHFHLCTWYLLPWPPTPPQKRICDMLYMMTQSLSFVRAVSPPSPPNRSRWTMESCAIGPVELPRRRSAARLSPRSAAFLNIAVALHDFSSPMSAVLRGWSATSRLMVLL